MCLTYTALKVWTHLHSPFTNRSKGEKGEERDIFMDGQIYINNVWNKRKLEQNSVVSSRQDAIEQTVALHLIGNAGVQIEWNCSLNKWFMPLMISDFLLPCADRQVSSRQKHGLLSILASCYSLTLLRKSRRNRLGYKDKHCITLRVFVCLHVPHTHAPNNNHVSNTLAVTTVISFNQN